MKDLIEPTEWHLVRELGRLLGPRKASLRVERLRKHEPEYRPHAHDLEVELRYLLMDRNPPQSLSDDEFETCQATLKTLCLLLEELVSDDSAATSSMTPATSYPRLRGLLPFLASTAGPFDLIHGPNTTLFKLPRSNDDLERCLEEVTKCSKALSKLFTPHPAPGSATQAVRTKRKYSKDSWKKAGIREQATTALETLFGHFKCGTAHEVLLRLTEDTCEDSTLQMMLPRCQDMGSWFEARWKSLHLCKPPTSHILDICTGLPESHSQGSALDLFLKNSDLVGAWGDSTFSAAQLPMESLRQLITKGVFERFAGNINAVPEGLPISKFDDIEKRTLAVRLGFCLMNFFNAEIEPENIYFLDSSSKQDPPYLAFRSKFPAISDPYNFRFEYSHHVLVSFAKLLLEIQYGQADDLDIIPDPWTNILHAIDKRKKYEGDCFGLQAINGCYLVHLEIAKARRSCGIEAKDAGKKIRRKLYKKVVSKLQEGLAASTPRTKRQRSESPPPSDRDDDCSAVSPSDTSPRSVGSVSHLPQRKRPRATDVNSSRFERNGNSWHHSIPPQPPSAGAKTSRPTSRDEFKIAIVCALKVEYDAVSLLVDEFWDGKSGLSYGKSIGDPNWYRTGRIGKFNVVLLLLSDIGKASSASSTTDLARSYPGLKLMLLTGICGGVPRTRAIPELLLGDVVISNSVIQHDLGRQFPNQFAMKDGAADMLGRPQKNIRNLVSIVDTSLEKKTIEERTDHFLGQLQQEGAKYEYPGADKDQLFEASFRHKHRGPSKPEDSCLCHQSDAGCKDSRGISCEKLGCLDTDEHLVSRERLKTKQIMESAGHPRDAQSPSIFVGPFGSGDTVLKSAEDRDEMAEEYGIVAFEMEGAGAWDVIPCIVIKGVCDYADSHKDKSWQAFASATAASAMRALLERYMEDI